MKAYMLLDQMDDFLSEEPSNLPKAFRALFGTEVGNGWPEPAIFETDLDRAIPPVVTHAMGYWVVLSDAKLILEELIDAPCEFLPAKLVDSDRELEAWVLNPLREHDALDPIASDADVDPDDGEIYDLETYVLDGSLVAEAPQVFRLKGLPTSIFLHVDLVEACAARGLELPVTKVKTVTSNASPEEKERQKILAAAHRVGWKSACQEGNMDVIEVLLSETDPDINGDRSDSYQDEAQGCITGAPYYTPLGEAARYGHVDVVQKLLDAGALVDRLNYRSETALHQALAAGKASTAKLLLEAGANPNLAGCLGNSVTSCRLNKDLVELVLRYGADPTAPDPWGQTTFDALAFDIENPEPGDSKRALGILERLVDVWPQEHSQFEPLKAFVAEASEALMSAKDRKKLEAKRFRELGRPRDGWVEEILAMLEGDLLQIRPTVDLLVKHTMSWDAPISSPDWRVIVERLIDMTADYSELTEEVYGERLGVEDMDEDEGGVLDMIADERLCTAEDVFTLLAKPAAMARADYAELFTKMCEVKLERLGHYSFGQDELEELLGLDGFGARADADKLRVIAGQAYPNL